MKTGNRNEHLDNRSKKKEYDCGPRLIENVRIHNQLKKENVGNSQRRQEGNSRLTPGLIPCIQQILWKGNTTEATGDESWDQTDSEHDIIVIANTRKTSGLCSNSEVPRWDAKKRMNMNQQVQHESIHVFDF